MEGVDANAEVCRDGLAESTAALRSGAVFLRGRGPKKVFADLRGGVLEASSMGDGTEDVLTYWNIAGCFGLH